MEPTEEQRGSIESMAGTSEWEVSAAVRIMVDSEEDARAVAEAMGAALGMLPFINGTPELKVVEL